MGFTINNLKQFTMVLLFIWSLTSLIPFVNLGANNLIAFLMLYAIVIVIKRQNITFESYKFKFIGLILIPYSIAIISIIVLDLFGKKIPLAAEYSCYFMRGNYRPVSILVSVGVFMWATTWKMKESKVVDYLAESTFGVYLFHMYPSIMSILFEKIFSLEGLSSKPYVILYCVGATASIFFCGVLIDSIRKMIFFSCKFLLVHIQEKNKHSV